MEQQCHRLAGNPVDQSSLHIHRGFLEGATQQAEAIVEAIQGAHANSERALPVWVTGHSLGGAYANCLMLHLLESRGTARLFMAGKISSG